MPASRSLNPILSGVGAGSEAPDEAVRGTVSSASGDASLGVSPSLWPGACRVLWASSWTGGRLAVLRVDDALALRQRFISRLSLRVEKAGVFFRRQSHPALGGPGGFTVIEPSPLRMRSCDSCEPTTN